METWKEKSRLRSCVRIVPRPSHARLTHTRSVLVCFQSIRAACYDRRSRRSFWYFTDIMQDPIQRHPTRGEQLDILATMIADLARPGDGVLDLGCGTGYLAHLVAQKRTDLAWTGVDLSADSLAAAPDNVPELAANARWIQGDLSNPNAIDVGPGTFRFVTSALTFHDLDDAAKQAVLAWAVNRLADDGYVLFYDRIRLTEAALFPLQLSIWGRMERVHGRGMMTAADFGEYESLLSEKNRPGRLADYAEWFAGLGLVSQPLHLHGNVVLIGATRP